jgi:hypothetical protein
VSSVRIDFGLKTLSICKVLNLLKKKAAWGNLTILLFQVYVFLQLQRIDLTYMCINDVFIGGVTRVIFFSLGHVSGLEHLSKFRIVEYGSQ